MNIDILRLSFDAARRRRPGAWILFITILLFYFLFASFVVLNAIEASGIGYIISGISLFVVPIGLSLFLAGEFARTNKSLVAKLTEVESLSAEKQHILSSQNETLEKQVEERTAQLKASQNQLIQSEKLASLGELTAGIAHEIQNPLNFVNNFSELSVDLAKELKEEAEKSEIDKDLIIDLATDLSQNQEKISHHGKRASSIAKGMLEHSRTSIGVKELTNINTLADEYLRLSYHGYRAKDNTFNATLETHFDENLPKIEVIPQDIGRVLLNLFNNAFYAVASITSTGTPAASLSNRSSPPKDYSPKVTIKTRWLSEAEAIELRVQDNGIGMSEATKAKIFQPFFTTKPTGQGTGLGLSLAYDIITKGHGGTIEVISTEGVGSDFIITLPFKHN